MGAGEVVCVVSVNSPATHLFGCLSPLPPPLPMDAPHCGWVVVQAEREARTTAQALLVEVQEQYNAVLLEAEEERAQREALLQQLQGIQASPDGTQRMACCPDVLCWDRGLGGCLRSL